MKAYRQLETEAKQFWERFNDTILEARIDLSNQTLRSIHIEGVRLSIAKHISTNAYPEHYSPWR
jgi:hypothetical protein